MITPLARLALLLLIVATCGGQTWRTNLDSAQAESRASNQMLMLDFGAEWCTPCKLMEAKVYTPAFLASQAKRLVPVRVDIDRQQAIARRYNVEDIPTLIFTDSWGGELVRHSGILDAKSLAALIEALPADMTNLNLLEQQLLLHKTDGSTLAAMGRQLQNAGLYSTSNAYLLRALQHKPASREDVMNGLVVNNMQLRRTHELSAWLRRCLKEFPTSPLAAEWTAALHRLDKTRNSSRRLTSLLTAGLMLQTSWTGC